MSDYTLRYGQVYNETWNPIFTSYRIYDKDEYIGRVIKISFVSKYTFDIIAIVKTDYVHIDMDWNLDRQVFTVSKDIKI